MRATDLLAVAIAATAEPDGAPVLGDACLELGWRDMRVPALLIGVPLDDVPPDHVVSLEGRHRWCEQRLESLAFAAEHWDTYAGRSQSWARAVLAVLLFGDWPGPMRRALGTRCPWPIVRRNAQGEAREKRRSWRFRHRNASP